VADGGGLEKGPNPRAIFKSRTALISTLPMSTCEIVVEPPVVQSSQLRCDPRSDEGPRTNRGPTATYALRAGSIRCSQADTPCQLQVHRLLLAVIVGC